MSESEVKAAVQQISTAQQDEAMFTLCRIGFCSVSKVAPVQCEQELMLCCGAKTVPKSSQCEQKRYPLCNQIRSNHSYSQIPKYIFGYLCTGEYKRK